MSKTLTTTDKVNRPLLTGSLDVVPGIKYKVKVEVKLGDLDGGSDEYLDISIDGNANHRCTPSGTSAGSCEWYYCQGINDFTPSNSKINLRFKYGYGYDWNYSGPCDVDGQDTYAAARITLIPDSEMEGSQGKRAWQYSIKHFHD